MKRKGLWFFFLFTFGYTWGLGALYFLFPDSMTALFGPVSITNPLAFSAVWAPTLSAIVVSLISGGFAGLKDLFSRLVRLRFHPAWYIVAVGGIVAVSLAGKALSAAVAGTGFTPPNNDQWPALIGMALLAFLMDPGPLGEELGWRGFALPRMLERWSALTSAMALGVIWAVWHLPAFFIAGMPQSHFPFWAFLVQVVSVSIFMTWVFNHTRQSVVPAILIHWSVNRVSDMTPPVGTYVAIAFATAALALIVFTRGRLGFEKPAQA